MLYMVVVDYSLSVETFFFKLAQDMSQYPDS